MLNAVLFLALALIGLPTSPNVEAHKVLALLCEQLNPFNPDCNPEQAKCQTFVVEDNTCLNQTLPYEGSDGPAVFTCISFPTCLRVLEFEGPDCSTANSVVANTVVPCGPNAPCDDSALLQAMCYNDSTVTVNQCVEVNGTVTPDPFTPPNVPLGTCVADLPYPDANPPFNASLLLQGIEASCFLVNVSSYFPSNHTVCTTEFFSGALLMDTNTCQLVDVGINDVGPSYGIRVTCAADDEVAAKSYPPLPPHLYRAARKAAAASKGRRPLAQRRRPQGRKH